MSIIERERQAEEVLTEREERARILDAAALEIEVRGWHQGGYHGSSGEVCVLAAMTLGGAVQPMSCAEMFGIPSNVAEWNDTPGRTAAEVTFLLRWRAEEIRDGL